MYVILRLSSVNLSPLYIESAYRSVNLGILEILGYNSGVRRGVGQKEISNSIEIEGEKLKEISIEKLPEGTMELPARVLSTTYEVAARSQAVLK
jgi:hypothetical protein